MSEAKASSREPQVGNADHDLLDTLAGIDATSPTGALRAQRADIASFIQGSYDALLEPADEAGVSRVERGLIALREALLEESVPLIAHYRAYLAQQDAPSDWIVAAESPELGAPLSPRLVALLGHVDRLTREPDVATPAHLAELKAQGLTDTNLVTISQLIAFVSFQVRAIVGLQLLAEEK